MLDSLVKKLLAGGVTLFLVVTLTFVMMRLLPGGPFDRDRKLPPAVQQNIEARYHLYDPVLNQYGHYLGNLLKGELGPSYTYQSRSVNEIVLSASAISFQIGFLALIVGLSLGIVVGCLAGLTQHKSLQLFFAGLGSISLSIPTFLVGGLLVLLFSLTWKLLPTATLQSPLHFVLPVLTLSTVPFSFSFLLIRSTVLEMKQSSFVQIKRSYGQSEFWIALKHILRNSFLPLIAILGPVAAAVVTGSFAVESIFAIPGLGRYFVSGVFNRDYPLVLGITLVFSLTLITFNTLTDMLAIALDPRLRRVSRSGGSGHA